MCEIIIKPVEPVKIDKKKKKIGSTQIIEL